MANEILTEQENMRHVLGISGKDSLAAALLIKAHQPSVWGKLELFSTLTGADYPETIKWLNRLPSFLGKPIEFIDGDIFGAINRNSKHEDLFFLPNRKSRYCTRESKIKPFQKWLGDNPTTLYTGIRFDEQRVGYKGHDNVYSVFPLQEYKFNLGMVWSLVLSLPNEFQPPNFYWASLHNLCREEWKTEFPLFPDLDSFLSEVQKKILFSGRTRPNCFFCFNQRQYEIVWLYETYPNLFKKMQSFEKDKYSWIQDFPLRELTESKREKIKRSRARKIVNDVASKNFGASIKSDGFELMPSCGLFCGK